MRTFACIFLAPLLALTSACSREPEKGVIVDKAFRTVISRSATVIAGLRLKELRGTDLYRQHAADINRLVPDPARLGLDARRDLDFVGFTWDGEQALVFAQGQFKRQEIEKKLTSQGGQRSKIADYTVISTPEGSVAFLSDRVLLAGPLPAVKAAIDLGENGTGEIPEVLIQQLRTLPPKAQLWVVTRGGLPLSRMPLRSDMMANLSNFTTAVSSVSLGLEIDSGSHLQGFVGCISPEGATRVHDALRGLVGLGRLSTTDNQTDLLQLYDAIKIEKQEPNLVRVSADLPREQTERLLTLLRQLPKGLPAPADSK